MGGPCFVDLFCGAGGSALGFVRAGFRPLAALDRYAPACLTYEKNIGVKPVRKDAFRFDFTKWSRELGDVDVLVGCPPCQGFSRLRVNLARKYWGVEDDPRNELVLVYLRAVEALKPRAAVFENVPHVAESQHFTRLVEGLRRLGYAIAWSVLEAADYGVPQRRKRLILVAVKGGSVRGFPPPRTHGKPGSPEVREGLLRPWRTVNRTLGGAGGMKASELRTFRPAFGRMGPSRHYMALYAVCLSPVKDAEVREIEPARICAECRHYRNGRCALTGEPRRMLSKACAMFEIDPEVAEIYKVK